MSPTVVFIVLDAFRWDYLNREDTPFLWERSEQGLYVKKLVTASGFTQRTAIFCGTWADTTGLWTMHEFAPDASPFRFLRGKRWPRLAYDVTRHLKGKLGRVADARIRTRIYKRARQYARHPSTARIPLHLLHFFSVSEDKRPIQEKGALATQTVFDRMIDAGVPFQYLMYPEVDGSDDSTERALLDGATSDAHAFFALFSGTDQVGHRHGTQSSELRAACRSVDARLRRLDAAYRAAGRDPTWLILGDHGMLDVTQRVDVVGTFREAAARRGLVEGEDWLVFCDSTLAKGWELTDRASGFLDAVFETLLKHGKMRTPEIARQRRIPAEGRRFGDRAWLANPGVLIWPDYFHRDDETIRGMHGYDPCVEGQKGCAFVSGPGIGRGCIEEGRLVDVCPTFCELVGIEAPAQNEGASWLQGSEPAQA